MRKSMMVRIPLLAGVLVLLLGSLTAGGVRAEPKKAAPKSELQAAFVRDGDLWVAAAEKESKLAQGPDVRNPRWSADGRWIAYSKGEQEKELWLREAKNGRERKVSDQGGINFQWSPTGSKLAYLEDRALRWEEAEGGRPAGTVEEIGNYGWLPDGSGFIVSSVPHRIKDNWAPIRISTVRLDQPSRFQPLHTIPSTMDKNFAVGTGRFKWSADGRWVAFLAVPTASWSADSNSLCVLSADGERFLRLGFMVHDEDWFQWSPGEAKLAFIEGEGREGTANKRLTVVRIPAVKPVVYTPAGYVDRDFAWDGDDRIVVSRAKESEWTADPAKRPFPFLVGVELKKRRQTELTERSSAYGDYDPVIASPGKLAWVRSNRTDRNSVLLGNSRAERASVWIDKLDPPAAYYEQFYWSTALDVDGRPMGR
ncbi:PD40 domain-containing protein [Cohnella sp. AR92]|uniref:PD40 domain-containing protein n=1 Tax=Cohnella sp. AR92 TaxID=648716 RepID=UPI000F8E57FD|nr:PD40 domain-containing protein [Cohnella sp. AR92]RUS45241.1 hypothetical protein ELR57_20235 [Cohnella sp. AR92]